MSPSTPHEHPPRETALERRLRSSPRARVATALAILACALGAAALFPGIARAAPFMTFHVAVPLVAWLTADVGLAIGTTLAAAVLADLFFLRGATAAPPTPVAATLAFVAVQSVLSVLLGRRARLAHALDRAYAEARGEADRWLARMDQAPFLTAVLRGPELRVDYAHPRVRAGLQREVLGLRLDEAMPELVPQGFVERIGRVLATGEADRGTAVPIRLQLGARERVVWFDYAFVPIRDASGAIEGVLAAGVDVSARVESERRLAAASEFEQRLLGIVSHDIRNPLSAIRMGVETLRAAAPRPEQLRTLDRIDRSSARIQALVSGLLDLTRVRAGVGLQLRRRVLDLAALVEDVVEEVAAAERERVQVTVRGDVRGAFDGARLEQVVSNLVRNALQHGARDAPVTVTLTGSEDTVALAVGNCGPPIAEALRPFLFEPFRAGEFPGRLDGSVGLGLYIAQAIARAHGGAITVESGPGGTLFTLQLPRMPAADPPAPAGPGDDAPTVGRPHSPRVPAPAPAPGVAGSDAEAPRSSREGAARDGGVGTSGEEEPCSSRSS